MTDLSNMTREELLEELRKAQDTVAFTHEWYAVRVERLREFAKEQGVWRQVACILANGTLTDIDRDGKYTYDPPTYAQQMSYLRWEKEKAEKQLAEFKAHCSCKMVNK